MTATLRNPSERVVGGGCSRVMSWSVDRATAVRETAEAVIRRVSPCACLATLCHALCVGRVALASLASLAPLTVRRARW